MMIRKHIVAALMACAVATPSFAGAPADDLLSLQHDWAQIKYRMTDKDAQEEAIEALAARANQLSDEHGRKAEFLVWQAIVLSTQAGIDGGLGALGKVKEARKLLEEAEKADPDALDGAIATSLGSLYYQVPGWPIGFGSKKKARKYLTKAVAANPDGIDSNFFYGDFLAEKGEYEQAREVLMHALEAPARPDRPLADAGRKEEIKALLEKIESKLGKRS